MTTALIEAYDEENSLDLLSRRVGSEIRKPVGIWGGEAIVREKKCSAIDAGYRGIENQKEIRNPPGTISAEWLNNGED